MSQKNDYWKKRFEELEEQALSHGEDLYQELEKQYALAYQETEKNILKWYNRFIKDNNVTFAEAKKMLTSGELKEFQWSLEEYIKYASDNNLNIKWAKELQNASTRVHISRLDTLRIQIQNEIEKIYDKQIQGMTDVAETIYEDNYYHTAYELQKGNNVAWKLQGLDTEKIEKVLALKWTDNSNFSSKIWDNKQSLLSTLTTGITQNMIRGNSADELIKTISKQFNTDLNKAGRLVCTESAFFAAEAQKDCFNDLGVEKYKILGTLDATTCETCGHLDLQEFDMKDYQEGVTAPPFHPWCRCTTIPSFEDEFEFGERAARDTNGNTYYVDKNMTYDEWKEKYLDNTVEAENIEDENILNEEIKDDIIENNEVPTNIDEFYDYCVDNDKIENITKFGEDDNGVIRGQELNRILGYDAMPTVISNSEFEALAQDSNYGKLYRGVSAENEKTANQYTEKLKYGNFYAGKGVYGNGTYVAYGAEGLNTVKTNYMNGNGKMMTMLLDKNAKTVSYLELYKMRNEELKTLSSSISEEFKNAMLMDCGYYASIKGYDAIIVDEEIAKLNNQPYIVILNRGKVIISE